MRPQPLSAVWFACALFLSPAAPEAWAARDTELKGARFETGSTARRQPTTSAVAPAGSQRVQAADVRGGAVAALATSAIAPGIPATAVAPESSRGQDQTALGVLENIDEGLLSRDSGPGRNRYDNAGAKASAETVVLDPAVRRSAVSLAEEMRTRYPPSQYVIVGVGRSPTLLIAALQNRGEGYAYNLPLSKFRHRPRARPSDDAEGRRPLSPAREQALFEHFDHFLPSPSATAGRAIVVVDVIEKGRTLLAAAEYLGKYLSARGRSEKLLAAALLNKAELAEFRKLSASSDVPVETVVLTRRGGFSSIMGSQEFDGLAQYGRYDLPKSGKRPAPASRPGYDALRRALAQEEPDRSWLGRLRALLSR